MWDSLIRSFLCSDQIDHNQPERVIEPKQASYIDALIECSKRASKIASVSEIEKYWKDTHKSQVIHNSQACSNHFCSYFWTSNKPINNSLRDPRTRQLMCYSIESSNVANLGSLISHSISGKEIQEIYLDENTLIDTERINLASFKNFKKFETLQLITNPNPGSDDHSCICVMYEPRKVHKSKVSLTAFRFYSLQGRGWTADLKLPS